MTWTPAYRWLPLVDPHYVREHLLPEPVRHLRAVLHIKRIHWQDYKPRPKRTKR